VADHRSSTDLRTLQEVHRLLASSDFANADDLVRRGGTDHLAAALHREHRPAPAAPVTVENGPLAPLPRRR